MCFLDATTADESDFIGSDLIFPDRRGETYGVAHSPSHRWYYYPNMQKDEALLLKCFDSTTDDSLTRFTGHTSFRIPDTPETAPVRESIEIRVIAFFVPELGRGVAAGTGGPKARL